MPIADDRPASSSRSTGFASEFEVNHVTAYTRPILANYKGHTVNMIATGNAPGHSPVTQCVDEDGHVAWVETERLTVIDPNFIPVSGEKIVNAARALR